MRQQLGVKPWGRALFALFACRVFGLWLSCSHPQSGVVALSKLVICLLREPAQPAISASR